MNGLAVALLVVAGAVALVDWWSVARDRPGAEYIAKPMVIVALVGLALAVDTGDDIARGIVVAALGASLVGDVVLMAPESSFTGGVGAFLVAHLLYVAALADSVDPGTALAAAIVVVGVGLGVVPRLLGGVRRHGRLLSAAVAVYTLLVATTAVFAVGTGVVVAGTGGLLLLTSDALLGWGRFVGPTPGGRTLVHATYHVGQTGMVLWLTV